MNKIALFQRTRVSLALFYAGVMGLILSILGIGTYRAIAHAHWLALDGELKSLVGTLHDSLELKLKKPAQIEPIVYDFFPNLCVVGDFCDSNSHRQERHFLGAINHDKYYIRLFNTQGNLIAQTGIYPQGLPDEFNPEEWQTLQDIERNNYRQISVLLHTTDLQDWGYFQVGRNFQDYQDYLAIVRWSLILGWSISFIVVAFASWYLAGLAMKPIYKSYNQIQQFTADAAHELRTPLAASLATVDSALLMPQLEKSETREILKTVQRQQHRLTDLVADLLLLSHIDQNKQNFIPQLCCLNDLVSDLVEELAGLAISSQINLISDIKTPQSVRVWGDEKQLYRLVSNLIVNGIKYTPPQGEVRVILEQKDRYSIIKVQDTGIGISTIEQQRIFDRFYRVETHRSRHKGGSGLGLSISKAIAIAHKGSLTVESELGKGSTFCLKLPLFP